MGKRFTDTDKWKKPFLKNLTPELKLLWFYILDDCDIAGLWQVDFDVAQIRTGCKFDSEKVLNSFGDHIIILDEGNKWFIPSFLEFQNGSQLSKTNNIFKSIDKILTKYDLYQFLEIEITETGTTIGAMRGRISQKTKDRIILESEFICQYCSEQKTKNELVIDHFIPLKKGGNNDDENLICSCIRCNSHKTDLMPDDFLSRQLVFLHPSEKIISLNKKLKAPISTLSGTKVMDKGTIQGQGLREGQGTKATFEENFEEAFDEMTLESYRMQFPKLDLKAELSHFMLKCNSAKGEYHTRDPDGLRLGLLAQLKLSKSFVNGKSGNKKDDHTRSLLASITERHLGGNS